MSAVTPNFFDVHRDPEFENPLRPKSLGYVVTAICVCDDKLYHVEEVVNWKKGELQFGVFNTFGDPKSENALALRQSRITAFHGHNGVLYDASARFDEVKYYQCRDANIGEILVTVEDKEGKDPIALRPSPVKFMFSYDNRLYDVGDYGISDTLDDRLIHIFEKYPPSLPDEFRHKQPVTAVISHEPTKNEII